MINVLSRDYLWFIVNDICWWHGDDATYITESPNIKNNIYIQTKQHRGRQNEYCVKECTNTNAAHYLGNCNN